MSVLHLCPLDKFVSPFMELLINEEGYEKHYFLTSGEIDKFPYDKNENARHVSRLVDYVKLMIEIGRNNKIVFHSIFNWKFLLIIALQPWLLKKSYWVIWGGDLYSYQTKKTGIKNLFIEQIRRFVIKRFGFLVTNTTGDIHRARKWYSARGSFVKCLVYPGNSINNDLVVCNETVVIDDLHVMVGNSGDPTNKHNALFNWLNNLNVQMKRISCPLAYGDNEYIGEVLKNGTLLFESYFTPQIEMLLYEDYMEYLSDVDICIFGHERQQGFGNTVQLLSRGKTVYLNEISPLYDELANLGFKVKKSFSEKLTVLSELECSHNVTLAKKLFSKKALLDSLKNWLSDE